MQLTLTDYLGDAMRISSLERETFREKPLGIEAESLP